MRAPEETVRGPSSASDDAFVDAKVAGYIAKYATKGAEATSTADRPIRSAYDLATLRQARADHRAAEGRQRHPQPEPVGGNVVHESRWQFAGSGYGRGETIWADAVRERVRLARAIDEDGNTS